MIITIIILGLYFNLVVEGLLFFISFFAIRTYAGGYHSKDGITCYFSSSAIMLMFFMAIKFLPMELLNMIVVVLSIMSTTTILKFEPISTENNPIDYKDVKYFNKKIFRNLFLEYILIFLLFLSGNIAYGIVISLGIILSCFLLILQLVINKANIT